MTKFIVREPNGVIRLLTQKHLDGHMKLFFAGIFLYTFLDQWVPEIIGVFMPRNYMDVLGYTEEMPADVASQIPNIPFVMLVYAVLLGGALTLGRALYTLYFLRNHKVSLPSVFDGFQFYLKALLLYFVMVMIISAMTMLLVIPGVIAYFMFSQAFYILADDPSKGVFRCLAESRYLMIGNKMKLFSFDMTYILLIMICMMPSYLVQAYGNIIDTTTLAGALIYLVLRLPLVYAMGQLYLGQTVFYELMITGGFRKFQYKGEDTFRDAFSNAQTSVHGFPFPFDGGDQIRRQNRSETSDQDKVTPYDPGEDDSPDEEDVQDVQDVSYTVSDDITDQDQQNQGEENDQEDSVSNRDNNNN